MTIAPVLEAPAQHEVDFIQMRRQAAFDHRQTQAAERRMVLARIREQYRNAPAEEVDDSCVIGRGQTESAGLTRPEGMRTRVR